MSDISEMGAVRGDDGRLRCPWAGSTADYQAYHDDEWGRPVVDDVRLYEKLCLEGFQSGLSWLTILRKREGFRRAFAGFEPGEGRRLRRRRRRPAARATPASSAIGARSRRPSPTPRRRWRCRPTGVRWPPWCGSTSRPGEAGRCPSVLGDLPPQTPESVALSKALRRYGFRFIGPTTAYAAMQSLGLVNDHLKGCHVRAACEQERREITVR